jgi:hypothetical protein
VGISLLAAERKPCRSETWLHDHTCGVVVRDGRGRGDGGVCAHGMLPIKMHVGPPVGVMRLGAN